MTPYLSDPDVTLYAGDALEVLRDLPAESVHCIATSPPFYALRDYGVDGQIGLESTPEEWAQRLVEVFREARRVLRKDGTLWVECGDSYATGKGQSGQGSPEYQAARADVSLNKPHHQIAGPGLTRALDNGAMLRAAGLKAKDLVGTPWMLAFALRADGWWLRGCNIWAKPNAMPESAKDRCTTAHSYVFQLSRSARYFFDGDAISEPAAWERWGDQTVPKHEGTETAAGWIKPKTKSELRARSRDGDWQSGGLDNGKSTWPDGRQTGRDTGEGAKHPRSVWTIPTQGFPEAHFATWPEALARRIILAACPEGGTVLDPFAGSGTTLYVARKLGRRGVGIDLNPEYLDMAARRLSQQSLLTELAS